MTFPTFQICALPLAKHNRKDKIATNSKLGKLFKRARNKTIANS
jgi:hypothetical protein